MRGLVERGAIGLVTTHDLALTSIAGTLNGHALNVHFEDHLEGGEIRFDYQLRPGVVTRSNALELMRAVKSGAGSVAGRLLTRAARKHRFCVATVRERLSSHLNVLITGASGGLGSQTTPWKRAKASNCLWYWNFLLQSYHCFHANAHDTVISGLALRPTRLTQV